MPSSIPFTVNDKSITIHFEKAECYKENSGICPIDQGIRTTISYKSIIGRNEKLYCPSLLYDIQKNGFHPDSLYDEICICHCIQTDSYDVYEGRHRVCIAMHSPIKITAIIKDID